MKSNGQRNGVRQYKKSALPRRQCLKNRSLVAVVAPSSLENQCHRRRRLSSSRSLVVVILMERTRKRRLMKERDQPASSASRLCATPTTLVHRCSADDPANRSPVVLRRGKMAMANRRTS
nr:hypothetical protein Itr_chr03CG00940 [Ipomoea trifida]